MGFGVVFVHLGVDRLDDLDQVEMGPDLQGLGDLPDLKPERLHTDHFRDRLVVMGRKAPTARRCRGSVDRDSFQPQLARTALR